MTPDSLREKARAVAIRLEIDPVCIPALAAAMKEVAEEAVAEHRKSYLEIVGRPPRLDESATPDSPEVKEALEFFKAGPLALPDDAVWQEGCKIARALRAAQVEMKELEKKNG